MVKKNWKYYVGLLFLVLSFLLPLLGFLVARLNLPLAVSSTIIGLLIIGGPELMILLAALFLGKETLLYIKHQFFKLFKKNRKPKPVSKARYYVGLSLMLASIIPLYLAGYFPHALPKDEELRLSILFSMDLLFVCSFFIAGEEFWEKFKNVFLYNTHITGKK